MPSNSDEFLAIIFGSTSQINLHKFKIRFVVAKNKSQRQIYFGIVLCFEQAAGDKQAAKITKYTTDTCVLYMYLYTIQVYIHISI